MENLTYTLTDIEAANAPNSDLVKGYVRPLGSFEHLFWLLDQESPIHFSLAAQIKGATTVGDWRVALDKVQRRHPFFSVCIEKDENSNPCFRQVLDRPIPVRVARLGSSQSNWLTELQRELITPFDPGRAPLVRAVLMHEPHRATLILTAHHSIADGLSLTFVIRDTLLALSGEPMDPLFVTPSMESILDAVEGGPIDHAFRTAGHEIGETNPVVIRREQGTEPSIRELRLSAVLTESLRKRARQEETTVHGALCAALVLAGRQALSKWTDNPVRVLTPIDIRKLLGMGEHCGVFVSTGYVSFEPNGQSAFWELARLAKHKLAGAQTPEGIFPVIQAVRQSISEGLDLRTAWEFAARGFAHEAVVTNLGNLRYNTSFGNFKLEAVWGPAIGGGFEGRRTIGVVTVNGALHLLHTTYSPVPFLLERMEQILFAACEAVERS